MLKAGRIQEGMSCSLNNEHGTITFHDNPNVYRRIIHRLQMSHLRHNNNLVYNICSLNQCCKARHHLVVRFGTFECFKLLISIITCLQNLIGRNVWDFYWGKTFWVELLAWNGHWINTNHRNFLKISLSLSMDYQPAAVDTLCTVFFRF